LNKNLIFLDIDHVLNDSHWIYSDERRKERQRIILTNDSIAQSTRIATSIIDIRDVYLSEIKSICFEYSCDIVICSSWRRIFTLEELKYIFSCHGFKIHDVCDPALDKADAIIDYVNTLPPETKWCVIDDCIDLGDVELFGGYAVTPDDGISGKDIELVRSYFEPINGVKIA
jgi:hypothetical protein